MSFGFSVAAAHHVREPNLVSWQQGCGGGSVCFPPTPETLSTESALGWEGTDLQQRGQKFTLGCSSARMEAPRDRAHVLVVAWSQVSRCLQAGSPRLCSWVSRQHQPHRMQPVPCDSGLLPLSCLQSAQRGSQGHNTVLWLTLS